MKKETWSYSLNGHEFAVAQGGAYTVVKDHYGHTSAQILGGQNTSSAMDYTSRPFTQIVDTGWRPCDDDKTLRGDILSLTGMAKAMGSSETPVSALSMSYEQGKTVDLNGGFGIATLDDNGNWVNAVSMNFGGTINFVAGPWSPIYALGTYGVDSSTKTAWAVINYNGDFAVSKGLDQSSRHRKK